MAVSATCVKFLQRRIHDAGGGGKADGGAGGAAGGGGGSVLHHSLFHPIAGDSLSRHPIAAAANVPLKNIQFSILDAATINRIAVVTVTSPLCNESPGSLTDLRMGANQTRNQSCETCGQHQLHCPGHFGRIVLPHPVVNPLFVPLLTQVLQAVCVNCNRLRVSPFYVLANFPGYAHSGVQQLQRLKNVAAFCERRAHCQFCRAPTLTFKQNGICITATAGASPVMVVPAAAIYLSLVRLPRVDLMALGFTDPASHPCNAVMTVLPVLPPVSRPSMRTTNLKTGGAFVVDDTITTEYQSILNAANVIRTAGDAQTIWVKYTEMHGGIERVMLDQGKDYRDIPVAPGLPPSGKATAGTRGGPPPPITSMRSRWVGKAGRIRREGMGKRVNFCARSVVTCDSYIGADEILVPHHIIHCLTYPLVVHPYNLAGLTARMQAGGVLFVQRASQAQPCMRAIERGAAAASIGVDAAAPRAQSHRGAALHAGGRRPTRAAGEPVFDYGSAPPDAGGRRPTRAVRARGAAAMLR